MRPTTSLSLLALTTLLLPAACALDAGRASDAHDRDVATCDESTCVESDVGTFAAIPLGERLNRRNAHHEAPPPAPHLGVDTKYASQHVAARAARGPNSVASLDQQWTNDPPFGKSRAAFRFHDAVL